MSYIDGFVIACPAANKQQFIEHARACDPLFIRWGALRVVECWGDDVPTGTTTDFQRAVQARPDEVVLFSWIEWPDKATRDAGMAAMQAECATNPLLNPATNPMPFDGQRMIFGGFVPVLDLQQA